MFTNESESVYVHYNYISRES